MDEPTAPVDAVGEPQTSLPPVLKKGWRFYLGVLFFILAIILPLFIPLVALLPLSVELRGTIAAVLAIGMPEVLAVVAVAVLGRETFDYLMGKLKRSLRRYGPARKVSRARYTIGLVLFCLPIVEAMVFLHYDRWRGLYEGNYLLAAIVWDGLFVCSFFVLGGDFWDKVRALFVYDAKAVFPDRANVSEARH